MLLSTIPRITDTRLTRWKRILSGYQGLPGALPTNDPSHNDTLRATMVKVARALNKVSRGGFCDCVTTTSCECSILITQNPTCLPPSTTPSVAVVGQAYSSTLTAPVCATTPIHFAITSGSLPPGLSLDGTTGIVSGTPTTPGNYCFTAQLTAPFTPPPAPLVTAYWTLDEIGHLANRVDSVQGIALAPNTVANTGVNGVNGLFNNGVGFSEGGTSGDGFSVTNETRLKQQTSNGWSLFFWFSADAWSTPSAWSSAPSLEYRASGAGMDIFMDWNDFFSPQQLGFSIQDDNFNTYLTSQPYTPTLGIWTFVHIFFDANSTRVGYQINNGSPVYDPSLGAVFGPNTKAFLGFSQTWGSPPNGRFDLVIDEMGIKLDRNLTPQEVTFLWNGGAGRTWPLS